MWPVSLFFLKEFIALYYWYIELFTRKILNIHSWIISCPDGITPNSGLTGPRILYIYVYIYIYIQFFNQRSASNNIDIQISFITSLPKRTYIRLLFNFRTPIFIFFLLFVKSVTNSVHHCCSNIWLLVHPRKSTHRNIYIYIYIYMCVCVCVCVCVSVMVIYPMTSLNGPSPTL